MMKPADRPEIFKQKLRSKRRRTADILDESISTVIRHEQAGRLRVIKDTPRGAVFHPMEDVLALARAKTINATD